MAHKKFTLSAKVSSDAPPRVKPVLLKVIGSRGTITPTDDGFEIHAELVGESARELNRNLLSELRRVVKKTRLRSEWSHDGIVEKFFDYVSKGERKS